MVLPVPLFQLKCEVNEYEWGKVGEASKAAQYALATKEADFAIGADTPYAELWMGTHPSGPSRVLPDDQLLSDVLDGNAALCGQRISEAYDGKLPFLFKVLSIQKALSIQCHPTKELARKLHKDDPDHYKDDNHKPEMAIAITPFEGFCGFRPIPELVSFLTHCPALATLLGDEAVSAFTTSVAGQEASRSDADVKANRAALKTLFTTLMHASQDAVRRASETLVRDAKDDGEAFAGRAYGGARLADLLLRLNAQFPYDIGLFCSFFLNYVTLQPGESLFLRALDCHAYLSGDIIECMAASDNVVRAGFTPKFKDVANLTEMLTYAYAPPRDQKMTPAVWERATSEPRGAAMLYDPPIEEFSVVRTTLQPGETSTHGAVAGPSIVIATAGNGQFTVGHKTVDVAEGQVYFVGADATLKLENHASSGAFITHRAFVEIGGDDDDDTKQQKQQTKI